LILVPLRVGLVPPTGFLFGKQNPEADQDQKAPNQETSIAHLNLPPDSAVTVRRETVSAGTAGIGNIIPKWNVGGAGFLDSHNPR
jgi:hypothetical protein